MGVFVFLPLVLPLTAVPIARLAGQHLHPRAAARLLTAVGALLGLCSTLCLGLLMVVGTAQLPGNPLPDGWSDPEVREAVPYEEYFGEVSIVALVAVLAGWAVTLFRHCSARVRAHRALAGLPGGELAVLPDDVPYAYALPGRCDTGRIVVSTALLEQLESEERRVVLAHERAHLRRAHHRLLLLGQLAARANPLLRPLRDEIAYYAERWADEEAAGEVGSRRVVARAVARAALVSGGASVPGLAQLAAPGPVPRRVAALLAPSPPVRSWPPAGTAAGVAAWMAAAGSVASALSAVFAATALTMILHAATAL